MIYIFSSFCILQLQKLWIKQRKRRYLYKKLIVTYMMDDGSARWWQIEQISSRIFMSRIESYPRVQKTIPYVYANIKLMSLVNSEFRFIYYKHWSKRYTFFPVAFSMQRKILGNPSRNLFCIQRMSVFAHFKTYIHFLNEWLWFI